MSQNRALLTDATATGSAVHFGIGGVFMFLVAGDFDGATIDLEVLGPDGATWIGIGGDASLTAPGGCIVELAPGDYRVSVTGGTSPAGLYATLQTVD